MELYFKCSTFPLSGSSSSSITGITTTYLKCPSSYSITIRCILPKVQLLNFEVAPMLDLRVTPTSEDCIVEMLSCKFEGSDVVERQNDRFSASMRNHITWSEDGERYLDIDVKLNISLEVYTRPFTYLPTSAIEKPGNVVMQSLVDRLVPLLLQQLLQDYDDWVQEQLKIST
ncbi:hypothetical protein IFM89_032340 [Coptis chinensis]|uniref:DUF1997 family protein n=1 Tax=Coptis chinensis TaxID=261450 RepID=A0A835IHZ0_9MAGN|nr:hypothetical protein IFM89_032340 [Coptis chinensis]